MAIAPLTSAGLQPATAPRIYREYTALSTVLRWSLVYIDTTTGKAVARLDAGVNRPLGVALNYAAAGEKVTVCIDEDQLYRTTLTAIPLTVPGMVGVATRYTHTGNVTAKPGSGGHQASTKLGASGTTAGQHCIQLIGPSKIKGNPYGDGSGSGSVDNIVDVRLTQLIVASDES